jgi:hypothetical protein
MIAPGSPFFEPLFARKDELFNAFKMDTDSLIRGQHDGTHGLLGFDPTMGFSRLTQGKRLDGGDDRAALNLCEQLTREALRVGPIVEIVETYRCRHSQGPGFNTFTSKGMAVRRGRR